MGRDRLCGFRTLGSLVYGPVFHLLQAVNRRAAAAGISYTQVLLSNSWCALFTLSVRFTNPVTGLTVAGGIRVRPFLIHVTCQPGWCWPACMGIAVLGVEVADRLAYLPVITPRWQGKWKRLSEESMGG